MPNPSPHRLHFTKESIANLPVPDRQRRYWYDSRCPGLAICITPTGTRTFYLYRKVHGRPERIRLGTVAELTVEEARRLARQLLGQIAAGQNPAEERRRQRAGLTVAAVWNYWFTTHCRPHNRSWRQSESRYRRLIEPDFGKQRLTSITPADVAAWHVRIGESRGRRLANASLQLLNTLFHAAEDLGYAGINPCRKVKRYPESSRDRFLCADELRQFWQALSDETDVDVRHFLLLALFTGARRSNLAACRWTDLDLDQGIWRIPAESFKTGRTVTLPLAPPAVAIFEERRRLTGDSPFVFPAVRDRQRPVASTFIGRRCAAVLKRAGLESVRLHDLRRTLASWAASAGESMKIVAAALGHSDTRTTSQVYARLKLDAVRDAVTRVVDRMLAIANGTHPPGLAGR